MPKILHFILDDQGRYRVRTSVELKPRERWLADYSMPAAIWTLVKNTFHQRWILDVFRGFHSEARSKTEALLAALEASDTSPDLRRLLTDVATLALAARDCELGTAETDPDAVPIAHRDRVSVTA
jgi:hypothetical protein